MSRPAQQHARDQRLLWEPLIAWQQLPEDVREQALDVLTALYLETIKQQETEIQTHDDSNDH